MALGSWTRTREKSWAFLAVFLALLVGLSLLSNLVFFRYGTFAPVYAATGGLINSTLIASMLRTGVIVFGLLVVVGRLRGPDFGFEWRRIGAGVFALVGLWAALNLVMLAAALLAGDGLALHPQWAERGALPMFGSLLAQVFGNALVEEIEFRGFLLPQLWLKLRGLAARPRLRTGLAVLGMTIIFSLSHIPNRIAFDQPFNDWALLMGLGAWFAAFYLRTGSLFVAVAVHTLHNTPLLLFDSPLDYALPIMVLDALLLLFWPRLAGIGVRLAPRPEADRAQKAGAL